MGDQGRYAPMCASSYPSIMPNDPVLERQDSYQPQGYFYCEWQPQEDWSEPRTHINSQLAPVYTEPSCDDNSATDTDYYSADCDGEAGVIWEQWDGGLKCHCQYCGKVFAKESNLKAHKRIHTGDKPYKCNICQRSFAQRSSLVTHKRTHTGEKPFPCTFCPKQFADSSTLTKHLRTHTGFKPYECTVCTARFTQSGNLKRHLKTHGYGGPQKVGNEYVIPPDWRGELILA